jgi:hypothetical protein
MKILRNAFIVLLGLPGFGFFNCGPPPEPPSSDDCSVASAGTITSLAAHDISTGMSVTEGDVIHTISGPQGGDMIGLELRYETATPIPCFGQTTRLVNEAGEEVVSNASALNSYFESAGRERTDELWIIPTGASFGATHGQRATLIVEAYGQRVEHTGWLGYDPTPSP